MRESGWKQYHSDRRIWCKKSTNPRQTWAVDFCERHSGECFSLSKMSNEAVDALWRCGLFKIEQRTRPLPRNGTNEHAKMFHPVRETGAKRKSAARARVRSAQIQRFEQVADGVLAVKDVAKPGFDFDREGNQAKIGFDFEHVAKSWHASWNATPIPLEDKESP